MNTYFLCHTVLSFPLSSGFMITLYLIFYSTFFYSDSKPSTKEFKCPYKGFFHLLSPPVCSLSLFRLLSLIQLLQNFFPAIYELPLSASSMLAPYPSLPLTFPTLQLPLLAYSGLLLYFFSPHIIFLISCLCMRGKGIKTFIFTDL